jgi:hypothetical protein
MKKLLTIALAAALVVSMTVPAMAMHFEMNGQLRARIWYLDNYWPNADGVQKGDMEFIDQRFRTTLTWGLTESVFLKARADINEGFWGDARGQVTEVATIDPVTNAPVQGLAFDNVQTKDQIAFDQMYGQVAFPGAPLTLTIGRQPVNWGTKSFVGSDNRDRVKAMFKAGAVTLGLVYDKFIESFEQELVGGGSDSRGWGLLAVGNVSGFKTGLIYYLSLNEAASDAFVPAGQDPSPFDNTFHNINGYLIGQAGPVALKAEVQFATGEAGLKGSPKTDVEGWGVYAGGFFNAGITNLGLEVAWARGNDPGTADNEGIVRMDYHTPFNSVILFNGMDYQGYDNLANGVGGDIGFSNALGLKGSVTASPSEKLSLTGAVVWAQRDEVPMAGMDDDLGWEADIIATYNLYDNVAFTAGFGYLWAGDYYGSDVDDPLGLMVQSEIKF